MLDFLTDNLLNALKNVNIHFVYEIRIRAGKPVSLNYGGSYRYLGAYGLTDLENSALRLNYSEIETIVYRASEYSVYSVTEQLKQGFLTGSSGERLGLAGVFVYEHGQRFTVKEITSLNIRVPHEILGCADRIYNQCFSSGICSALILSSPGRGKTTILRDLARQISKYQRINILINDERNEISASFRDFSLDVGISSDVIRFSDKKDAFTSAVRSMRPDLIITDELVSEDEIEAAAACVNGGVAVVASAHCRGLDNMKNSLTLSLALHKKIFKYYIFLAEDGIGQISGIYDDDLNPIYII